MNMNTYSNTAVWNQNNNIHKMLTNHILRHITWRCLWPAEASTHDGPAVCRTKDKCLACYTCGKFLSKIFSGLCEGPI